MSWMEVGKTYKINFRDDRFGTTYFHAHVLFCDDRLVRFKDIKGREFGKRVDDIVDFRLVDGD